MRESCPSVQSPCIWYYRGPCHARGPHDAARTSTTSEPTFTPAAGGSSESVATASDARHDTQRRLRVSWRKVPCTARKAPQSPCVASSLAGRLEEMGDGFRKGYRVKGRNLADDLKAAFNLN